MPKEVIFIKVNNQEYQSKQHIGCGGCAGEYDSNLCSNLHWESPIGCGGIIWVKANKKNSLIERINQIREELDAMEEELKGL